MRRVGGVGCEDAHRARCAVRCNHIQTTIAGHVGDRDASRRRSDDVGMRERHTRRAAQVNRDIAAAGRRGRHVGPTVAVQIADGNHIQVRMTRDCPHRKDAAVAAVQNPQPVAARDGEIEMAVAIEVAGCDTLRLRTCGRNGRSLREPARAVPEQHLHRAGRIAGVNQIRFAVAVDVGGGDAARILRRRCDVCSGK